MILCSGEEGKPLSLNDKLFISDFGFRKYLRITRWAKLNSSLGYGFWQKNINLRKLICLMHIAYCLKQSLKIKQSIGDFKQPNKYTSYV
jgi:hypothetical protein